MKAFLKDFAMFIVIVSYLALLIGLFGWSMRSLTSENIPEGIAALAAALVTLCAGAAFITSRYGK